MRAKTPSHDYSVYRPMTPAQQALADLEAAERGVTVRRVRFWLVAVATVALYLVAVMWMARTLESVFRSSKRLDQIR
jgi:hypothetical protein